MMDPLQAIEAACDQNLTKALLIGEFETDHVFDSPSVTVDWTAIKEIQRAILEQARLNMGWRCSGCGSTRHILAIRDGGKWSCCPERRLVPPEDAEPDRLACELHDACADRVKRHGKAK